MKKIIAMLLCIVMVLALGAQAFALTETDEDRLDSFKKAVEDHETHAAQWNDRASVLGEVEEAVYAYKKVLWDAHIAGKDTSFGSPAQQTAAKDLQLALLDIKKANPKDAGYVEKNIDAAIFDALNYANGTWDQSTFDSWIDTYKGNAKSEQKAADDLGVYVAYYQELVDEAAAKKAAEEKAAADKEAAEKEAAEAEAAAEKAAAERAALVAKLTKGIDQSTAAGKLLAQATVNKYDFENNMKAAKKSAEAAQKTIDTAKKAAFTTAQALVLEAQTAAYNKMASEISVAVDNYVSGVYEAIAQFYADLG
jgi:chemotaxis protein histidine kinase CheA